jgi:polar amino acid transport system substrate-binding protein
VCTFSTYSKILLILFQILYPCFASAVSEGPLSSKNYSKDIQDIITKGKLIVAILKTDNPPFFMRTPEGKLEGIDIEISNKIAKELGVTLEINRTAHTYDEVINLVASGKVDIGVSKLSYTDERAKKVLYTKPYAVFRKAMLVNRLVYAGIKKRRDAKSLIELFSKTDSKIGVVKKSSYIDFAKSLFPYASIMEVETWDPQGLKWLLEGKLLALFRDEIETRKFLLSRPEANLKLLSLIIKSQEDSIRMVVPLGQLHLLFWVNGFLETNHIKYNADMILEKNEEYLHKLKDSKSTINYK